MKKIAESINIPSPDEIIKLTAIQSEVVAIPFLFLAKRIPAKAKYKEKIAIKNKKIATIIDIGIAVKKMAAILRNMLFLKAHVAFCLSQAKLPEQHKAVQLFPLGYVLLIESAL